MSSAESAIADADARHRSSRARKSENNKMNLALTRRLAKVVGAFENRIHDCDVLCGMLASLGDPDMVERFRVSGQPFAMAAPARPVPELLFIELPGPVEASLNEALCKQYALDRHSFAKRHHVWLYRGFGIRNEVQAFVAPYGGTVTVSAGSARDKVSTMPENTLQAAAADATVKDAAAPGGAAQEASGDEADAPASMADAPASAPAQPADTTRERSADLADGASHTRRRHAASAEAVDRRRSMATLDGTPSGEQSAGGVVHGRYEPGGDAGAEVADQARSADRNAGAGRGARDGSHGLGGASGKGEPTPSAAGPERGSGGRYNTYYTNAGQVTGEPG